MRALWKRICVVVCVLLTLSAWSGGASAEDDRLINEDELNQWMDGYVRDHGLNGDYQRFSVGFCYTATGESWYYDADQWMYSASLYKVPVAMLMAEKEAAGELAQESTVLGMPLQYWESTALTYSNNDSGHAMVDYLGGTYMGKCSDMTIRFTDLPEDYFVEDFYQSSYYTARYMTQVMKTLYDGGEEQFPHVVEYLLPAQPDGYLNLSLKGRFELAQKYGAYEEPNGNQNNHIAAIVYTPTPVIITVMTRNVGEYQNRIAEVGAYLADYALELDAKAEALKAAREATPAVETAPALNEPDGAGQAESSPAAAGNGSTASAETAAQQAEPVRSGRAVPHWLLPAIAAIAGLALLLLLVLVLGNRRSRRKLRRQRSAARAARREIEQRGKQPEAAPQKVREDGYRPRH